MARKDFTIELPDDEIFQEAWLTALENGLPAPSRRTISGRRTIAMRRALQVVARREHKQRRLVQHVKPNVMRLFVGKREENPAVIVERKDTIANCLALCDDELQTFIVDSFADDVRDSRLASKLYRARLRMREAGL